MSAQVALFYLEWNGIYFELLFKIKKDFAELNTIRSRDDPNIQKQQYWLFALLEVLTIN